MNFESRPLMVIRVIFVAIVASFALAALAEVALPDGYVRYVTLLSFIGVAVIGGVGLAWFLRNALSEWEHHKNIVPVGKHEHILIRSDDEQVQLRELGEHPLKSVVVKAPRKRAVLLEDAELDAPLYQLLSNGGNFHDHEN
jgi:hypothetical protein